MTRCTSARSTGSGTRTCSPLAANRWLRNGCSIVNAVPSRPTRCTPAARTASAVTSPMCSSGTPRTAVSAPATLCIVLVHSSTRSAPARSRTSASAASSSPAGAHSPAACSRSISAKSTDSITQRRPRPEARPEPARGERDGVLHLLSQLIPPSSPIVFTAPSDQLERVQLHSHVLGHLLRAAHALHLGQRPGQRGALPAGHPDQVPLALPVGVRTRPDRLGHRAQQVGVGRQAGRLEELRQRGRRAGQRRHPGGRREAPPPAGRRPPPRPPSPGPTP